MNDLATASAPPASSHAIKPSDILVILPVYNAGAFAQIQVDAFKNQVPRPRVMLINSGSTDGSEDVYRTGGCEIVTIRREDFDHGATRNYAIGLTDAKLIVFMTHDCILHRPDAIARLCAAFEDPTVGVAYGRQLPRRQAKAIERHSRLFNYPEQCGKRSWPADKRLGIRASFNSNTFSACRRETLEQIGGFPPRCLIGEDRVVAGRALLAGWKVAYVSDALVEHSHGYTVRKEFQRYFENGVCDGRHQTLFAAFSSANGEGRRFVMSEMRYLLRHAPHKIPEAALRTALKLTAYHLGRREALLPVALKRHFTMYPFYFDLPAEPVPAPPSPSGMAEHRHG